MENTKRSINNVQSNTTEAVAYLKKFENKLDKLL